MEQKEQKRVLVTDDSGHEYRAERLPVSRTTLALKLLLALADKTDETAAIDLAFRQHIGVSLTDALASALVYLNDYRKYANFRWPCDPLINEPIKDDPKPKPQSRWNKRNMN